MKLFLAFCVGFARRHDTSSCFVFFDKNYLKIDACNRSSNVIFANKDLAGDLMRDITFLCEVCKTCRHKTCGVLYFCCA